MNSAIDLKVEPYKAGDEVSLYAVYVPGFVVNSTQIYVSIPLSRPVVASDFNITFSNVYVRPGKNGASSTLISPTSAIVKQINQTGLVVGFYVPEGSHGLSDGAIVNMAFVQGSKITFT